MAPTNQPAAEHHAGDSRPEFLVILGLQPPVTVDDVKQAYFAKVKTVHPDHGGDMGEFLKLQEAFDRATEWAQFRSSRLAWLGNWVEKYVEQDSILNEIESRGGHAQVEGVDWLRRSFGEDFSQVAEKVTAIELRGPRTDDNTLAWLATHRHTLQALRSLNLAGSAITGRGLGRLAAFPSLRELDLSDTNTSGADLALVLSHLPELRQVNLRKTKVGFLTRLKLRFKHPKLLVTT